MAPAYLPFFLAIPATVFLLVAPGFITLNLLLSSQKHSEKGLNLSEKIFFTLAISAIQAAWVGLVLASMGLFSIGALLLVLLLWTIAGGLWLWRLGFRSGLPHFEWKWNRQTRFGWLLALLLAGTTVLFYLAPHETVIGAQDSGVYFNTGVNIVRTGSLIIDDPLLQVVGQQGGGNYQMVLLGMPGGPGRFLFVDFQRINGYYVMDNLEGLQTSKVIPQFFHLYPTTLAIGYSLFGMYGGLSVNPFFGIMAVFALCLAARRMFQGERGEWVALLGALLLALNGIQVWFARQTLWEILGEFLLFCGIFAFTLAITAESPSARRAGAFVAGCSFGLLCLAHASQAPLMLGLLVPYFIWQRLTRRWNSLHWWLLGSFGFFLLHTILHVRIFSLAYWEGIYHNVIQGYAKIIHIIVPLAAAGILVLILLDSMPRKLLALEGFVARRWKWLCWLAAAIVAIYLLYSYFLRIYYVGTDGRSNPYEYLLSWQSYIGGPTSLGPERNLMRLGWYFSPPGILLAILGVTAMLASRFNRRTAIFLVVAVVVSYLFLDENYTQEGYIYSLRRYVNVTVPAFSLFIAYAALETLPVLGQSLSGWLGRFRRRKAVYAAAAGPDNASINFAITQPAGSERQTSTENGVTGFSRTGQKLGLGFGILGALGLVAFMLYTNRTLYTFSEYGAGPNTPGLIKQLEDFASRFGPKDVIIFSGERDIDGKPATSLTYLFNRPAFLLTPAPPTSTALSNLIAGWEKAGYNVKAVLGPDGGRLSPSGYSLKYEGEVELRFRQFESLGTQKPYNIQENSVSYGIYDLEPNQGQPVSDSGTGTPEQAGGWTLQTGKQDYAALVRGFSGLETEKDGTLYRWTTGNGVLRVPCLDPARPYRLQLALDAGMSRPASLPPLNLTVYLSNDLYDWDPGRWKNLTILSQITVQKGVKDYILDIPGNVPASQLTCKAGSSSLILQLVAGNTWQPVDYGLGNDWRNLGLKFLKVNLTAKAP